VAGNVRSRGLNVSGGWNRSFGHWNNNARASFNRNRTQISNLYGGVTNVEAALGITGVSTNPFDWGVPGLGFSHFNGLSDINPSLRRDQTWSLGDNLGWVHGKHNWRFGGDFRRVQLNPKTDQNARGSFTFTGFATAAVANGQPVPGTGFDFADFLLGLPQQTAAQFGVNSYYFRGNSWDAYVQDDWKLRSNVTLQLGLRYEYVSPMEEKFDRIVNLDVAPGFTAAAPVVPNAVGPFTGKFPAALVNPDRNNFAPRVGIAWKPFSKTVVRTGYGINYNTGAYAAMVQQMAFQPPFNFSATNIASASTPLTLQNGFPAVAPGTVTNNFGVDRNYALGYVQTWNFDVQQEVTKSLMLNAGYTGAKGTRLDMLRAPNRTPTGLRIAGVEPFTWQTSEGDSTMNSLDVRLRKRMVHGISAGGTYAWSKSLDNAASIGGSGHYVTQDDQDLRAERGLSSFDVRHRMSADYVVELPFGKGKRWLSTESWRARMFGDWMWSGNLGLQTGSPFTAIVLGDFLDVARGTNGTLRANLTGQPVALSNPTLQQWFNTAAFVAPPRGQFGDSRRNLIEGPGGVTFNSSVNKTITIHESQALELRIGANNVFNHPRLNRIDSTVNSPTFGQVTGVGGMRQVSITLRYRF